MVEDHGVGDYRRQALCSTLSLDALARTGQSVVDGLSRHVIARGWWSIPIPRCGPAG
jgi:hypothetical protein